MPRRASASRSAGWSESGSGAVRASRAGSVARCASSSPTRSSSQTAGGGHPTIEAGYGSLNSVSCIPSGVRSRALRPPHGGTTGSASAAAPAATSRPAVASRSSTSTARRTVPGDAPAGFDPVDALRLPLVEQLERGVAGVEQDHAPVLAAPVGELLETRGVAVEGDGGVEVRHGQYDANFTRLTAPRTDPSHSTTSARAASTPVRSASLGAMTASNRPSARSTTVAPRSCARSA